MGNANQTQKVRTWRSKKVTQNGNRKLDTESGEWTPNTGIEQLWWDSKKKPPSPSRIWTNEEMLDRWQVRRSHYQFHFFLSLRFLFSPPSHTLFHFHSTRTPFPLVEKKVGILVNEGFHIEIFEDKITSCQTVRNWFVNKLRPKKRRFVPLKVNVP